MPPRDKNNPATTFFWKDHESDEGLRACSLAAQGLWMRLLCLAARAEPVGNIAINGRPVTPEVAARIGGTTPEDAAKLMHELEDNGVFSRDRNGIPYSRRMKKSEKISEKRRKSGRLGGNPALVSNALTKNDNLGLLNHKVNHQDNQGDNPPIPLPPTLTHSQESKVPDGTPLSSVAAVADAPSDRSENAPHDLWRAAYEAAGYDLGGLVPNHWTPPAATVLIWRWVEDLRLTPDEIVATIRAERAKHSEPAASPRAYDAAMQRLAAAKAAHRMEPDLPARAETPEQAEEALIDRMQAFFRTHRRQLPQCGRPDRTEKLMARGVMTLQEARACGFDLFQHRVDELKRGGGA